MKKKKNTKYIPYDYDAAYQKLLENLKETEERRALKTGKNVYATKEIKAGDQLEIEIYPVFTRQEAYLIPDEAKRARQRQAQKTLDDKKSRKMCERLIQENFTDHDIWATFTYTEDERPADLKEAQKNMQNYIRRLNYRRKKEGLPKARYIYITECSPKGRWHHHIIMDGDLSLDAVEDIWKKGKRNQLRRIKRDEDGLTGMARYITKDKEHKDKYQKAWTASNGLKKPQEKVNHYKTKWKDVDKIVKGDLKVCDHLEKWYGDSYDFAEEEIRYNAFNGHFYIYARMRRKKERNESKIYEKKRRYRTDGRDGLGELAAEYLPGVGTTPPLSKRRKKK